MSDRDLARAEGTGEIVRRTYRYFLVRADGTRVEVDKARYVALERAMGFHNTMGLPDEPATASFSSTRPVDGYVGGAEEWVPDRATLT